jgi:hypothetical protein
VPVPVVRGNVSWFNLKTVYILISDVFFHKKMSQNVWATIMPFGPVTNILLAQKQLFGPAKGWPHFRHWV